MGWRITWAAIMPPSKRLHGARERLTEANEHARSCALFLSEASDAAEASMRMRAIINANESLRAAAVEYHDALSQGEQSA